MKLKKMFFKMLIAIVTISIGIMSTQSFAVNEKNIGISYFRYLYSKEQAEYIRKDGYALNLSSNKQRAKHPFFQLYVEENNRPSKTSLYCVNAVVGETWSNPQALTGNSTTVTYNQSYNLATQKSEIENLAKAEYNQIANSEYYKQIMWILDNIYIPSKDLTDEQNLENKEALLEKAGIRNNPQISDCKYAYVPQEGYDYSSFVSIGNEGYQYKNADGNNIDVIIPDELVEVIQQAAIWYFTNYKGSDQDTMFNTYLNQSATNIVNWLFTSYGTDNSTNRNEWPTLGGTDDNPTISDTSFMLKPGTDNEHLLVNVGAMWQEQATILCDYLIDAANNYAKNNAEYSEANNPLTMNNTTTNVIEKKVGNNNYYILGPIKINKTGTAEYELENVILVNNKTNTEAYIANENGEKINKTVQQVIGQDFYVAIPKEKITGTDINIKFTGNYKTTSKILWVSSTRTEQPVVELTPTRKEFNLPVNAQIVEKGEFDLALRKNIIKIVDNSGKVKDIKNEQGLDAYRNLNCIANDIEENKTATYKHRKDPVVVKKGDVITYRISVYNEGDKQGYPSKIVDKLPEGVVPKTYAENETKKGTTYGSINQIVDGGSQPKCTFSYEYNPETNEIMFENQTKYVLEPYGTVPFENKLPAVSIEVDCEVTKDPSTTAKTYLTNIAYIAEEHNSEDNIDIINQEGEDRDSKPGTNPTAEQVTTGDTYNGYKGSENNQSVYNDTNNEYFYIGQEDDDDFEIIVLNPVEFDLKLIKYISKINNTPSGRTITVDTTKLDNKTSTTANYNVSKNPLKVKTGDYVTYTFRIYNEGDVDGYASEITEDIPEGLEFVYDENITVGADGELDFSKTTGLTEEDKNAIKENMALLWSIGKTDTNGKITQIKTNFLAKENSKDITGGNFSDPYYVGETNLLKAYNPETMKNGPANKEISVKLKVVAPQSTKGIITNNVAITEDEDLNGNEINDRDSDSDENNKKDENWKKEESNEYYLDEKNHKKYKEDDEDYDNIELEKVDLALTKFIIAISKDSKIEDGEYLTVDTNKGSKENPYLRATKVDTTPLKNGTKTDAIYTMVKTPLEIPENSYVLYNIRVYNEGDVDVFAGEVKDYLPNYLTFVRGEENDLYGWKESTDGKTVTTNYLSSKNGNDKILKAFDSVNDDGNGSKLEYKDLPILCRINSNAPDNTKLVNTAEITKYEDENGNNLPEDVDSQPENVTEKNKEQRVQDDDDYEVVLIKKKKIDIALTKFITAISKDTEIQDGEYITENKKEGSKQNPYLRATKVDTTKLRDDPECHDAAYTMVKEPLTVAAGNYVLYNIRVYNEGEVDAFAGEITDFLPENLDFVNCKWNDNYKWKVESDGKTVKSTYLSQENGEKNKLKAFDKAKDDGNASGLDYKDISILCKVNTKTPSNKKLVNTAEITKYEDEDGNKVDKDEDSTPNNVEEKNVEKTFEDDDDYEVVQVKTFDLSLLKYVTEVMVTEDGKTTTTETGNIGDENDRIPKVEINRKKINSTVVKFGYTIKITNEGDIAGYAKEITDYVPEGLKFYSEDNKGWEEISEGVITTRLLEGTLLKPGESATVKVVFRWINGSTNLGLKTNTAEITEDYNDEEVPDRDSTPNNKVPDEDDIDTADVILSISTGLGTNIVKYSMYSFVILVILAGGLITIKKFVL